MDTTPTLTCNCGNPATGLGLCLSCLAAAREEAGRTDSRPTINMPEYTTRKAPRRRAELRSTVTCNDCGQRSKVSWTADECPKCMSLNVSVYNPLACHAGSR